MKTAQLKQIALPILLSLWLPATALAAGNTPGQLEFEKGYSLFKDGKYEAAILALPPYHCHELWP